MQALRDAIFQVVERDRPATVRQVFYRLVSTGLIKKTETEYKSAVGRLLRNMRAEGRIPYTWIADNTRWVRKPTTHNSLEEALRETVRCYRRSVWRDQNVYVEVWTEKDAIAGILMEETRKYDVPLMVSRGFSSQTYLYTTAQAIKATNKPTFVYYFGDHDPAGLNIEEKIDKGLREFAPKAEIHFERIGVTPQQIEEWNLPTRPTKRTSKRARAFKGESVEVDAIEPARLRQLCAECITRHIDDSVLQNLKVAEESERAYVRSHLHLLNMRSGARPGSRA